MTSGLNTGKMKREAVEEGGGLAAISDDMAGEILKRLPAVSFASAACVCRSWCRVCARFLSRPKLSSVVSLNPCPAAALREVVDKVLSEPIRPHFAIVSAGPDFELDDVLCYIGKKLGAQTPIVVSRDSGIIGRDVITNEVEEVRWYSYPRGDDDEVKDPTIGILLTVGYVPGLKVDAIPLLQLDDEETVMVDKFISDVAEYSAFVSGCPTPVGVVMFSDELADIKSTVEKVDFALPIEAALVGGERSHFVYRSAKDSRNVVVDVERSCTVAAVALIFAKDKDGALGSGEIRFHVVVSDGVSAVGPRYKIASAQVYDDNLWMKFGGRRGRRDIQCQWMELTARREGRRDILNGRSIVDAIVHEIGNRIESFDRYYLYVGVTKRRRIATGAEKAKQTRYLSFHASVQEVYEYLHVDGLGIKTGDCFQFYYADPKVALASCNDVQTSLRSLKLGSDSSCESSHQSRGSLGNVDKGGIFGGFIFASWGWGASVTRLNVDSLPFVDSFPGVPVGGVFCRGEIGRCSGSFNVKGNSARQCCHVYGNVCLVMSYTPCARA